MKRHVISIVVVLAVLMMAWTAFGQGERRTRQRQQSENTRQRFENMSEEEREKFRAEMRERRQRWQDMSEEEREKFRAEMRERTGWRPRRLGREEQLRAIEIIQEQAAKLKAAIEAARRPEGRRPSQELSEKERAELKERFAEASKQRQSAIREIEEQLAKLKGPTPPRAEPPESIQELRAIRELALKEKAEETAERLERLIARYQRGPRDRPRGPTTKPERDRERPTRPRRDVEGRAPGKRAPDFTLTSFDGETVSLFDYKGKIVVLEWFNFECPFVMYHYGQPNTMVKLANKYKDDNVIWFTVNSTSHTTPEANKEFAEKHKLPYLILDDRSGEVGRAYGAETTPHMFVIDTMGNIVYTGAIDNSPMGKNEDVINYVDQALAELTAGKSVSTRDSKPYGCSVKYAAAR